MKFKSFIPFIAYEQAPVNSQSIKTKFNYLRSHHDKVENLFNTEVLTLESMAETEESYFGRNQFGEEHQSDHRFWIQEIEYVHIRMHRYSTVLAIYAYLEISLQKTCSDIENHLLLPISVTDLNGSGITRCVNYINKLTDINAKKPSNAWNKILKLNAVRNCIMHGTGDTNLLRESNKNKLLDIVRNDINLDLIGDSFIFIKSQFIIDVLADVELYLLELHQSVTNKYSNKM
ncbi:hypothetical protein J8L98_23120 [Pseudoalteromonas sp. MMG013]|uniref:hypothetical protein n=1 Tax=Pseudoalteromonas sp. MMG013 TaxID=2822687 RepID=UPI001B373391|nr:hypothetical protein [Pseudoalteromonas sp. MMG013]MBQ4864578.1 hypothetical protein [Pseudoalteromonas sp. MMG013]